MLLFCIQPRLSVSLSSSLAIVVYVPVGTSRHKPFANARSSWDGVHSVHGRGSLALGGHTRASLHHPNLQLSVQRPVSESAWARLGNGKHDCTYPLIRQSPTGLKATENTQDKWPPRYRTRSPEWTLNSATMVASPQAARSFPPGENRTHLTAPTSPGSSRC